MLTDLFGYIKRNSKKMSTRDIDKTLNEIKQIENHLLNLKKRGIRHVG